ncbi:MAG: GGDEF domain-containing protein [Gammaproteobacteria bacterium]
MDTLITTRSHGLINTTSVSGNRDNVLPLFGTELGAKNTPDASRLLHLSNSLQSSLAIEDILSRFSDEIKEYVPHDFLGYSPNESTQKMDFDFWLGKKGRCKLNQQLTFSSDKSLGSLVISRKRKFSDVEAREFEHLTSTLIYPLRNAILYRDAVYAAHKDALTGIGNRAALDEALGREVDLAHRHDRSLGMIIIDIDHFKSINDTYGHATGDCLLKALSSSAEETIRLSDQIFRFGGEEFVVLLPETALGGVKRLAERIRRNIEAMKTQCEGASIKMTASFGVATLNRSEDEEGFFNRADKALYQAKHDGRNCTRIAD